VINLGVGLHAAAPSPFAVTYRAAAPVPACWRRWPGSPRPDPRLLVVSRGANQLASSLALVFFGLGVTAFFGRPTSARDRWPGTVPIPASPSAFLGPVLFRMTCSPIVFRWAPVIWWLVFRTR
jgi:hypothetical protein